LTAVLLEVSADRRPIEMIKAAGPKAVGILYGVVGGFGTAAVLVGVLIGFGILSVGSADRSTIPKAAPSQPAPGVPSAAIAPSPAPSTVGGAPPPAAGGKNAPPAPVNPPPAAAPTPTQFLKHPVEGKPAVLPNAGDKGAKPERGAKAERPAER
jgi:hypothetical protein